jgi:hypothetical protein
LWGLLLSGFALGIHTHLRPSDRLANVRVTLGQFMKELQRGGELITGRLDARFSGRGLDLLGEFAEYDRQEGRSAGPSLRCSTPMFART